MSGTARKVVPARCGTTRSSGSARAPIMRRFRTAATASGDNLKSSWIRVPTLGRTTGLREQHPTDTGINLPLEERPPERRSFFVVFGSFGLKPEGLEEGIEFGAGDGAGFAGFEAGELDVHDARAFEVRGREAEKAAHAAYLMFLTFRERYRKFPLAEYLDLAWFGYVAADIYSFLHLRLEIIRQDFRRHHLIFFLVRVFWIEQRVGDTPIVGEDNEPVGIFVEPADGEDAFDGQNFFYFLFALLRRVRDDAARFVVGEVAVFGLPPLHFHLVLLLHLIAQDRRPAVDRDEPLFDKGISLAPCAVFLQRQVLIDAHGEHCLSSRRGFWSFVWCAIHKRHYTPFFIF